MKKFIVLVFAGLSLSACASASLPGAMAVSVNSSTIIDSQSGLNHAVTAPTVTGGKDTNPMWVSNVSNADFAEALRQSLAANTMLATDHGRFNLAAQLVKLKQPLMGIDMMVTADVKYTLTDAASGKVIWEKEIITPYTATVGDALLGVKRLQLANEGAIKANIAELVTDLVAESKTSQDMRPLALVISQNVLG